MKALFPDTNVYLHCRRLNEIDWLELFNTDACHIVVPKVVIGELDKHKNSHPNSTIQKRARGIIQQLEQWFGVDNTVRLGVTIEPYLGSIAGYEQDNLDFTLNDDRLIAYMLSYVEANPSVETILVTTDLGIKLTAGMFGISVVKLPDQYVLEPAASKEKKEKRELERRVQKLEAAQPNLSVAFVNQASCVTLSVKHHPMLTDEHVTGYLSQLQVDFPFRGIPDDPAARLAMSAYGLTTDIDRYNKELKVFFQKCEAYFRECWEYRTRKTLQGVLNFCIFNTGTAPAEDMDIYLDIPRNNFILYDADNAPIEPERPRPPREPSSFMDWIPDCGDLTDYASLINHATLADEFELISIEQSNTEGYEVRFHANRCKHGVPVQLPPLFVEFSDYDQAKGFLIKYTLHAANLPEPVQGQVNVKVTKADQ